MQRNEESELKGNFRVQQAKSNLFPLFGTPYVIYSLLFTVHKLIVAFYIPYKAAFEDEPPWSTVYFDFYLDFVFFIDILIMFNMPLYDEKSRLITDRKVISIKYLRTWFIFDLLACWPSSYLRKRSALWPRTQDDTYNFVTLNFNSVPRLYRLLLLTKMIRTRRITEFLTFTLKKIQINV